MKIIKKYTTKNPCYTSNTLKNKIGYMQHSTATPGAKASYFISSWDKASSDVALEFVIDDTDIYQLLPIGIKSWHAGGSANNTHVGCEVCEPKDTRLIPVNWVALSQNKSNDPWAVTKLQQELTALGYDPNGIDGSFGPGCAAAVKQFQKDNNLDVDGSVGPATLAKFQTRKGSYLSYNPEANKEYFEDVYRKAVYTCAYVIKELGSTVTDANVLSHAEGYKKGIASNHADVGHWWPLHGKSMDDFRDDVKKYMSSGILPFEATENKPAEDNNASTATKEPPEKASSWAQEAWAKAYNNGIMDGTNPQGNVTREMLAVVLDALGLLD